MAFIDFDLDAEDSSGNPPVGKFTTVLGLAHLDLPSAPASGGANAVKTEALIYSLLDGDDVVLGTDDADTLKGGDGADTIDGFLGADTLVGGVGADLMRGGEDDDTYSVENIGDQVEELAGQGYDIVVASVRYTLAADQEIEVLRVGSGVSASTAMWLTGNEFGNRLMGHAGEDVLDGGLGADTMQGGWGDDTYRVDDWQDIVSDARGRGYDVIVASTSYSLEPHQEIEVLKAGSGTPYANLSFQGNEFANRIIGNAGANSLEGLGGVDTLEGGRGDDVYYIDDAGDVIKEVVNRGSDEVWAEVNYTLAPNQSIEHLFAYGKDVLVLTGNNLDNEISANFGNNTLDGGGGTDLLTGLLGRDTFKFSTAPHAGDLVHISDFASDDDVIELDHTAFAGLTTVGPEAFKDLATGVADADDRILYDSATGALFFDADGGGATAAIQFAVLDNHAAITAEDFKVV